MSRLTPGGWQALNVRAAAAPSFFLRLHFGCRIPCGFARVRLLTLLVFGTTWTDGETGGFPILPTRSHSNWILTSTI